MSEYNQTLIQNLNDIKTFLDHIQPRVAEGAFGVIYQITEEAIEQAENVKYAQEELQSYQDGGDSKFIRDANNYLKAIVKN